MRETALMNTRQIRTPRDLGPLDLVWDHFSRPRADDTVAKVRAAAAAGYAAIGLYLGAWASLRDDPAELERVDEALAGTGLVVANIEPATKTLVVDLLDLAKLEPVVLVRRQLLAVLNQGAHVLKEI